MWHMYRSWHCIYTSRDCSRPHTSVPLPLFQAGSLPRASGHSQKLGQPSPSESPPCPEVRTQPVAFPVEWNEGSRLITSVCGWAFPMPATLLISVLLRDCRTPSCWPFAQSKRSSRWRGWLRRTHSTARGARERSSPCYLLFLENNEMGVVNGQCTKRLFNSHFHMFIVHTTRSLKRREAKQGEGPLGTHMHIPLSHMNSGHGHGRSVIAVGSHKRGGKRSGSLVEGKAGHHFLGLTCESKPWRGVFALGNVNMYQRIRTLVTTNWLD